MAAGPHRDPTLSLIIIAKTLTIPVACVLAYFSTLLVLLGISFFGLAQVQMDYGLQSGGYLLGGAVFTVLPLAAIGLLIWALILVRRVSWRSVLPAVGSIVLSLTALALSGAIRW